VPAPSTTDRGRQERRSFGRAVAQLYLRRDRTESIEQRFIALLDADEGQLAHHLRQMVQLLRAEEGIRIHWVELLTDLRHWKDDERRVQRRWARAFYREAFATPDANDAGDGEGAAAANEGA
jgi:CRISPR system Cascade subunit CasB